MPGRSDDHPALFLSTIVMCIIIFSEKISPEFFLRLFSGILGFFYRHIPAKIIFSAFELDHRTILSIAAKINTTISSLIMTGYRIHGADSFHACPFHKMHRLLEGLFPCIALQTSAASGMTRSKPLCVRQHLLSTVTLTEPLRSILPASDPLQNRQSAKCPPRQIRRPVLSRLSHKTSAASGMALFQMCLCNNLFRPAGTDTLPVSPLFSVRCPPCHSQSPIHLSSNVFHYCPYPLSDSAGVSCTHQQPSVLLCIITGQKEQEPICLRKAQPAPSYGTLLQLLQKL